ncbi:MAG: LSM domain-containing protein [Halobacteriota archaeon]
MSGRPLDVLEASLDTDVTVHLKDGRALHGLLAGYDQHMNVVLEPSPELDEELLGELDLDAVEDTTIIRGDNVVTINV